MPKPMLFIEACTGVIVGSVVYFFFSRTYDLVKLHSEAAARSDYIISFDPERERNGAAAVLQGGSAKRLTLRRISKPKGTNLL